MWLYVANTCFWRDINNNCSLKGSTDSTFIYKSKINYSPKGAVILESKAKIIKLTFNYSSWSNNKFLIIS